MFGYVVIVGISSLIGMGISGKLKSKFAHYSKVPLGSGMSGAEVAKKMMDHFGIYDVNIVQGKGMLTDHYNPQTKTVSLSPAVFNGRSIASAAVAAHECGHVVQHAEAYSMLTMRSNLVPLVQMSSKLQQLLFFAMVAGLASGIFGNIFMTVLLATFGITALFSLVTLPVEFDASNRALAWIEDAGIAHGAELDGAKDSLWWAAMTYVAKAMSSLVLFLFILLQMMGGRN